MMQFKFLIVQSYNTVSNVSKIIYNKIPFVLYVRMVIIHICYKANVYLAQKNVNYVLNNILNIKMHGNGMLKHSINIL